MYKLCGFEQEPASFFRKVRKQATDAKVKHFYAGRQKKVKNNLWSKTLGEQVHMAVRRGKQIKTRE